MPSPPELEFSEKYDLAHAQRYFDKHQAGFWRNQSNRLEQAMARKALALAGDPRRVLDLPCGAGRFWGLLAELPARRLLVGDYSQGMLETARSRRDRQLVERIDGFVRCSAFTVPLPDAAVDCVFSMRFLHHVGESADRQRLLREFARVTADTVILSLWVDGNYQSFRRKRLEERRRQKGYQNRFVITRRQIEHEFAEAGLSVVGHIDMLPGVSMWRCYVLRAQRA